MKKHGKVKPLNKMKPLNRVKQLLLIISLSTLFWSQITIQVAATKSGKTSELTSSDKDTNSQTMEDTSEDNATSKSNEKTNNAKVSEANTSEENTTKANESKANTSEEIEEIEDNEDSENKQTKEGAIAQIIAMNPEDAREPNLIKPEFEDTTYTKEVSFSQKTLKGIFSTVDLYFYVPNYWETKYVYAAIQYDVSQLIDDIASSMTFSVNNVPIESCKVSYKEGNTQIAYVQIPIELVKEGYNSFSISAYARLFDDEGCVDDFSGANWFSIEDTSYIKSGYETTEANHKIAFYPYPFMSTTEDTGKGLTIAVSDKATDGEVAAAMNLMADLSSQTESENNIQFCLLSDIANTNSNRTIIVSNYDNLSDEYKNKVIKDSNYSEYATVNFTDDSTGNPLLIISSLNDDCLLEAAYMLMDEDRVSQERTDTATVNLGSAAITVNSTALNQLIAGSYTIEDISGSGLTFVGPFHQEQNIYLPFSQDYFLSNAGKVTLKFRYSENLDFTQSMISIYWGSVPIASKKLEKDKAAGDELIFTMPEDVIGTTTGSILIAFDLEIQGLECTPRQEQMPWAYISDDSTLFLPTSTSIVLNFDLKSSPFRVDGKFNDVLLVMSDNPTTKELNLYAQIVAMYGDGVNPYGTFSVKRSSEFSEEDADYNIITVGTYSDNPLIQSINSNLHFTYQEDGNGFASNEQLILSDTYANEIAILQLLESPFTTNRGVLAITGANTDSLAYVNEFMRNYKKRSSLMKDCVIIDRDLNTKMYQFITKTENVEEPSVIGTLVQNKQSFLLTIVSTSIMLIMLIAVIIILIRIRMYHKKNEK